jgi:N,N-dimethylformamidase beta subunit-like protein/tachylectin
VTYDPNQRFLALVPGGNGIFYAIQADGTLLWYRHSGWTNGALTWAAGGSGRVIGSGWAQFVTVLASADGQLFALRADGTLLWYRYILTDSNTGAGSWHPASGSHIGSGFNKFARLIGGWNGVLYGLTATGEMYWYRYAANNGTNQWGAGSGKQIGSGWSQYPWLSADPNGVIYGARYGGLLRWWRYVVSSTTTGAGYWVNGGTSIDIGFGWGDFAQKVMLSNSSGTIYTVQLDTAVVPGIDSTLVWYRLSNSEQINTAGVSWANGGNGIAVGSGFSQQGSAALQGYPSSLSTAQGGSLTVQVSTTFASYSASVLRLAPAAGGPVTVVPATSYPGRFQSLPAGYRSAGCGWSPGFTVAAGVGWPSGVYSARLSSPFGTLHDVVFVVRPQTPQNKIAVILPTSTYNAYNTWGGHDQYTYGQDGVQRLITLLRPSVTTNVNPTGVIDHTLYSDLLLLTWMTANNIQFDVYTDGDLHATGPTWLPSYKAVVLGSHAEYWTVTERQNLINYLNGGGRVVATGGNTLYEQVGYSTDLNTVTYRTTTGDRALLDDAGLYTSDALGVDFNPATYMDFFPYQVQNNHSFLAGTGLTVGGTFGGAGYNGAASGWEVDWAVSGVSGLVVIAVGLNPNGGASMCYVPKPNNGWVFTTGSIAFNGSIASDPAVQKILANVFAAALL